MTGRHDLPEDGGVHGRGDEHGREDVCGHGHVPDLHDRGHVHVDVDGDEHVYGCVHAHGRLRSGLQFTAMVMVITVGMTMGVSVFVVMFMGMLMSLFTAVRVVVLMIVACGSAMRMAFFMVVVFRYDCGALYYYTCYFLLLL